MANTGGQIPRAKLLGFLWCYPILAFGAAVSVLESPVLRVEVNRSSYSFRIVEKSTGQVLVSQSGTYFGGNPERVTQAKGLHKEAGRLQGALVFSQAANDVQVTFSFVTPEVVQVVLICADGKTSEIAEEFNDQGEHYYGIWESPFGGNIDNRGADYDFLNEELDAYVRLGIKNCKIDRGEEDEMPLSVENLNAILLPKLAAEGLADRGGNDFFDFSRNANDTARKYTAIWNGDTRPTFGGLAVSIKNGLRSGTINFPMQGSDTGGYLGNPDKELFARWLEFSAYSPMMEVLIGPKRTIWYDYDQDLIEIAKTYVQAHHDLIPYTRSYMQEATRTGMPIMRSLVFAFPGDSRVIH
jgi:hypothetical protein